MSSATAALPADGAAPKSKKKLMIILIAAVVLLGAGGGGGWFFLHQKAAAEADAHDDDDHPKAEAKKKKKKKEAEKPPVFSPLEPFTVNLQGGDHFMQLGIVLQLKDAETAEKVKTFLPQIRNHVLLLLSGKSPEDLETPKGKEALIGELLAKTRAPLGDDGEDVQAVLLGSMIIQ